MKVLQFKTKKKRANPNPAGPMNERSSFLLAPLEIGMWDAFVEVCSRENLSADQLCFLIEKKYKSTDDLIGSVRNFLIYYFRDAATEDGHTKIGHGHIQFRVL